MDSIRLHHAVCRSIDANAAAYTAVSDAIWDRPEVNFHEDFAASSLIAMLEEHGFTVTKNLAGLPNAFRAASDVKFSMKISVFSMWVFRVALSYVFAKESLNLFGFTIPGFGMSVLGVWVAMYVDWVFRAILFVIRFVSGKWLTKYKAMAKNA